MRKGTLKQQARKRRHRRVRIKISGTPQRPRLSLHRGLKNISAQLIDDQNNKVLLTCSTFSKEFKKKNNYGGNKKAAALLGELIADKIKKAGIAEVVFDRAGYLYHGRVKEFADAARKAGLTF